MIISVASGKGGTGKTLIATSLARVWADQGRPVVYADADAEEPNGHLFLAPNVRVQDRFSVRVPTLDGKRCAAHAECQEICAFNAILSTSGDVMVFDELCHGCGACVLACPDGSLKERDREIGTITQGDARGIEFVSGMLDVGEARVTPLINSVVDVAIATGAETDGIVIIDSPPGTTCSTMAAVERADLLLLVTEPTPFGLHDLALAIGMGRALGREMAVVINRADLGDSDIDGLLAINSIPSLAKVPFDRAIAETYSMSRMAVEDLSGFRDLITGLSEKLLAFDRGGRR